ncbi:hypothetical protein V6N11_002168 [Hibiscus sabdariffa]|uniref:Secreted protein n=1 Tax=Hibiscus sabdariffa TaxID=183260 RepID=A0ABR2QUH0_9ROSI
MICCWVRAWAYSSRITTGSGPGCARCCSGTGGSMVVKRCPMGLVRSWFEGMGRLKAMRVMMVEAQVWVLNLGVDVSRF